MLLRIIMMMMIIIIIIIIIIINLALAAGARLAVYLLELPASCEKPRAPMGLTLRETPLDPRLTRCEPLGYRVFSNTRRKNTPLSLLMLSRPFCASVCPYACFR
jgi:hypothetical protein